MSKDLRSSNVSDLDVATTATGAVFPAEQNGKDVQVAASLLGGSGFDYTGDGSPVAELDPAVVGVSKTYKDTTNGAIYIVVDDIGTPTWALVGGEISGLVDCQGVIIGNGQAFIGSSGDVVSAQMTDIDAYNNSGNGIRWKTNGTDGGQRMEVQVGPPGSPLRLELFADGELDVPGALFVAGDASFLDNGIILKSPNNTQYRVVVANDGTLSTVAV